MNQREIKDTSKTNQRSPPPIFLQCIYSRPTGHHSSTSLLIHFPAVISSPSSKQPNTMMSNRKADSILRSLTNVLLTQRDNGLMAQFREFTKQLKRAFLSLSMYKTRADAYSYTFDPHVDNDGNDIPTKSMRPAQELPA